MTLVFIDTETTGLDPVRHEIWEIGAIVRDHRDPTWNGEWRWQLQVDLSRADPTGLRVGRYYERTGSNTSALYRHPQGAKTHSGGELNRAPSRTGIATTLAPLLDGAHLVGAVVSFDAAFLTRFLVAHGQAATWHYHLIDVEAMAVGHISARRSLGSAISAAPLPWKSDDLSRAIGVEPASDEDRHTALGDARWAMRMYDAIVAAHGARADHPDDANPGAPSVERSNENPPSAGTSQHYAADGPAPW